MKKRTVWVVMYVNYPAMHERWFETEEEAKTFSATVNGSYCPIQVKSSTVIPKI